MENKHKSSEEAHSEPLQQCSVISRFSFDEREPEIGDYDYTSKSGRGVCSHRGKLFEVGKKVNVKNLIK